MLSGSAIIPSHHLHSTPSERFEIRLAYMYCIAPSRARATRTGLATSDYMYVTLALIDLRACTSTGSK